MGLKRALVDRHEIDAFGIAFIVSLTIDKNDAIYLYLEPLARLRNCGIITAL